MSNPHIVKAIKCDTCGKLFADKNAYDAHRPDCDDLQERLLQAIRERRRKTSERIELATKYARSNPAILCLCRNSFFKEARDLCAQWAGYNLWDCGSSSGLESVYDTMLQAAIDETLVNK